jgi:hypothetical protein
LTHPPRRSRRHVVHRPDLLLIGSLPSWPYSADWGYGPGGVVGAVLALVLVMALLGRI